MLFNSKKLNLIWLLLFKSTMTIKIILLVMDIQNIQFFIQIIYYKCKYRMESKLFKKYQGILENLGLMLLIGLVGCMIFNYHKTMILKSKESI
jgi:hypothetical protein